MFCSILQYSQLSTCGQPALTDTPIKQTVAKSPAKTKYRRLSETNSRYYGLSLKKTLTRGPYSVCHEGSWLESIRNYINCSSWKRERWLLFLTFLLPFFFSQTQLHSCFPFADGQQPHQLSVSPQVFLLFQVPFPQEGTFLVQPWLEQGQIYIKQKQ